MSINILVVDDSAVMRSMLLRTLHACGLPITAIHQAANGKDAVELLSTVDVDVALVDMNMPVMNGEALIDHIRGEPRLAHLAIVVVSTEGSDVRIQALQSKGALFIHKPFTPGQIRSTLLEALGVGDA